MVKWNGQIFDRTEKGSQPRKVDYPGPRGFLLFFLGQFCDANCFLYFLLARSAESREMKASSQDYLGSSRVIWLDGLNIFGDVIGQKKMTSLTAVKCRASMKVRFSTILTRKGIEWSLRAFERMRAVRLFLRAGTRRDQFSHASSERYKNYIRRAASTFCGERRAASKFCASWNLSLSKSCFAPSNLPDTLKTGQ